jgi:hypothetical protein
MLRCVSQYAYRVDVEGEIDRDVPFAQKGEGKEGTVRGAVIGTTTVSHLRVEDKGVPCPQ